LPDWGESPWARAEVQYAEALKKEIIGLYDGNRPRDVAGLE